MANWRDIILVTLYIIWWPSSRIFNLTVYLIVYLLAPVWTLISFILLPFIHLAQTIFNIITFPFSVQWLERIEVLPSNCVAGSKMLTWLKTLYVYLGTAALVGCLTGAIIFAIFKFISSSLNIDSAIVPQPKDRVRSAAEFRAARREKREEIDEHLPMPTPVVLKKIPGSRRKGLLSQAIVEEEDSDFWSVLVLFWVW
jgi:hypothetical protein